MDSEIRRHLDEAVDVRRQCAGGDCPVGAGGLARLADALEDGVSSVAWERTLAAAQAAVTCDETCPACESLVAILNRLTFAGAAVEVA